MTYPPVTVANVAEPRDPLTRPTAPKRTYSTVRSIRFFDASDWNFARPTTDSYEGSYFADEQEKQRLLAPIEPLEPKPRPCFPNRPDRLPRKR